MYYYTYCVFNLTQLVFKTCLTGIISESLIRPVRRRSTLPALDYNTTISASKNSNVNGAAAVSKNSSTPLMTSSEKEESSSDYCSQCSDVAPSRTHRRQCSITVSVNGDFFSCLGDDEEDGEVGERDGGKGEIGKVPSYLRSLWREMDQIMKDIERARRQEALENQHSSSWSRLMWLVRRCSPSRLPLVGSMVGGSRGNDPADPADGKSDDFEDSW